MVHLAIMEAYDAAPGDEDEHGPRFFFAADSRVRRFNADIEAWLRHMHSVVPIVAVVRTPDGEAGGTDFSDWHRESHSMLPAVLSAFDDHITKRRRASAATDMLDRILWLAEAAGADIPLDHFGWWRPEQKVLQALRTGDLAAAARLVDEVEADSDQEEALFILDLSVPEVRAGLLALSEQFTRLETGFRLVVAAAVLDSADPLHDARVEAILANGSAHGATPRDALVLACRRQPDAVQLQLLSVATQMFPENAYALLAYLGQVIRCKAWAEVDLSVLARAEQQTEQPGLFTNTTNIRCEREEWDRGIAMVDLHEAKHPLPKDGWLNAGLLHLGAGHLDRARHYARGARQAGDDGAQMLEVAPSCRRAAVGRIVRPPRSEAGGLPTTSGLATRPLVCSAGRKRRLRSAVRLKRPIRAARRRSRTAPCAAACQAVGC